MDGRTFTRMVRFSLINAVPAAARLCAAACALLLLFPALLAGQSDSIRVREMPTLTTLDQLLADHQAATLRLLPILPPDPFLSGVWRHPRAMLLQEGVFSEKLLATMDRREVGKSRPYELFLREDPLSRERQFLRADGTLLFALPAPAEYNPRALPSSTKWRPPWSLTIRSAAHVDGTGTWIGSQESTLVSLRWNFN